MSEQERNAEADLAMCAAATSGPWELCDDVAYGIGCEYIWAVVGAGGRIALLGGPVKGDKCDDPELIFAATARESLPYWINRAVDLEKLAEGQSRQIEALQKEFEVFKRQYDAEVDEFNAGYQAARDGLGEDAEPTYTPHDVWRCGYAWGAFEGLKAEVERLRGNVEKISELWTAEAARLRKIIDDATGHSKDGDGVDLLCQALYGRKGTVTDWLGGSEARMLYDAAKEIERLRELAEANALDRLRAWRNAAPGRWFSLENDIGCPDCLALGELPASGNDASRLIVVASDDEPHTEANPATFAEMVDAALARWQELYGEDA